MRSRTVVWAVAGLGVVTCIHPAQAQTTDIIANVSSQIPPALNDAGQAAFPNSDGVFRGDGTTLVQIVGGGQAAPDGNGSFSNFNRDSVTINGAGLVAFEADLAGTSDDNGVFRGDGATLTRIARGGTGGSGLKLFDNPIINASGQVAFDAFFASNNDFVIYRGDGATLTQIAREGQLAPDGNGTYSTFQDPHAFNDAGQVAFLGQFRGTSGFLNDNTGIFRGSGGGVTQIVREGDDGPDNGSFPGFSRPTLNNAGQVAFQASLSGNDGGSSDNNGIFLSSGGSIAEVVRKGDNAPDGNGTFFSFGRPALNNTGQVAFEAFLTGNSGGADDNTGIYRSAGGGATKIAREGQLAPDGNGRFSDFFDPAINDDGQVVFFATLTDTDAGFDDDQGIFFYDDSTGLLQVAREGGPLSGTTINQLAFNNGGDVFSPQRSGLNNRGQVAFEFQLNGSGGSGVARWSLASVLTGDYNDSGLVEQGDLDQVLANWGASFDSIPGTWINQRPDEGIVDQAELDGVLTNWGSTAAPDIRGTNLPEPLAATVLALTALLHRRPRACTPSPCTA